jgi:hypothetical protein
MDQELADIPARDVDLLIRRQQMLGTVRVI